MKKKDAIIYGAGRIGLLFGAKLIANGFDIGYVTSKKNSFGDRDLLISNKGNLESIFSLSRIESICPGDQSFQLKKNGTIILATKSYSLDEIIRSKNFQELANAYGASVMLLQNGIDPDIRVKQGIWDVLHKGVPVFGALVFGYSDILYNADNISLDYSINKLSIGSRYDSLAKFNLHKELQPIFNCNCIGDKQLYLNERMLKAVMNSANSVSAIFSSKIGDLLKRETLKQILFGKVDESISIAECAGHSIAGEKEKILQIYESTVSSHYSSMALDIHDALASRQPIRTEISDMDLRFYSYALSCNAIAPMNEFFTKLVLDITKISSQGQKGMEAARNILSCYSLKVLENDIEIVMLKKTLNKIVQEYCLSLKLHLGGS